MIETRRKCMNLGLIQELIRVELLLQLRGPLSVRYSICGTLDQWNMEIIEFSWSFKWFFCRTRRTLKVTNRSKHSKKRKFLFIHKGKSHRLNPPFGEGSVFDLSHMNEGYAPQNPEFWGFSKFERLFFWVNLIEFDSICIDLHRSTSISIDLPRSEP